MSRNTRGGHRIGARKVVAKYVLRPLRRRTISEDGLALMLCEGHRICVDHIRGHAAYQEQARRALAWDPRNG